MRASRSSPPSQAKTEEVQARLTRRPAGRSLRGRSGPRRGPRGRRQAVPARGLAAGITPVAQRRIEEEPQAKAVDEEVQARAEEEEVQAKAEEEEIQTKAEDEEVQAKAEDEEIQAKTEDENVQAKSEDEEVQTKAEDEEDSGQGKGRGNPGPAGGRAAGARRRRRALRLGRSGTPDPRRPRRWQPAAGAGPREDGGAVQRRLLRRAHPHRSSRRAAGAAAQGPGLHPGQRHFLRREQVRTRLARGRASAGTRAHAHGAAGRGRS